LVINYISMVYVTVLLFS